jgi:hypothetical protein
MRAYGDFATNFDATRAPLPQANQARAVSHAYADSASAS